MLKGPRALCKKKRMFPMLLTLPPPSHTLSPFTLSLLLPLPSSSLFAFHSGRLAPNALTPAGRARAGQYVQHAHEVNLDLPKFPIVFL